MRLDRMMCEMQKYAQRFGAIFGASEKSITERQNGWMIWRERVNVESPHKRVRISVKKIRKQCRKITNWKAPGKDGVQGCWIKNLSSLKERISWQMNRILMGEDDLTEWMHMAVQCSARRTTKKVTQLIVIEPLHASH